MFKLSDLSLKWSKKNGFLENQTLTRTFVSDINDQS